MYKEVTSISLLETLMFKMCEGILNGKTNIMLLSFTCIPVVHHYKCLHVFHHLINAQSFPKRKLMCKEEKRHCTVLVILLLFVNS